MPILVSTSPSFTILAAHANIFEVYYVVTNTVLSLVEVQCMKAACLYCITYFARGIYSGNHGIRVIYIHQVAARATHAQKLLETGSHVLCVGLQTVKPCYLAPEKVGAALLLGHALLLWTTQYNEVARCISKATDYFYKKTMRISSLMFSAMVSDICRKKLLKKC